MPDQIDWTRATVKITAPVQHTAMETVQELEVPLVQLPSLLRDLIDATRTAPPEPRQ